MEEPINIEESLSTHLDAQYSIQAAKLIKLDQGVFRIDRHDSSKSWVARIFPPTRPIEIVHGDAKILRLLQDTEFPSERCAHPEPVSTTSNGHNILVTEFVEGRRARKGEQIFRKLGDLLGRLHSIPFGTTGAAARRGGVWHHLCDEGGPREEIKAILSLLEAAKERVPVDEIPQFEELKSKLQNADDFEDLPTAFVHPDFVPSNTITTANGDLVIVDWAGAGTGPRISSLGFLLWAAGNRSMAQVKDVFTAYSSHFKLEEAELARLANAISLRPLVLRTWEFCTERKSFSDALQAISEIEDLTVRIASSAQKVLAK
jgi:Ser/Thr protein kinase RdoA (MazF antagonist)